MSIMPSNANTIPPQTPTFGNGNGNGNGPAWLGGSSHGGLAQRSPETAGQAGAPPASQGTQTGTGSGLDKVQGVADLLADGLSHTGHRLGKGSRPLIAAAISGVSSTREHYVLLAEHFLEREERITDLERRIREREGLVEELQAVIGELNEIKDKQTGTIGGLCDKIEALQRSQDVLRRTNEALRESSLLWCKRCDKNLIDDWERHNRQAHADEKETLRCKHCDRRYVMPWALQAHYDRLCPVLHPRVPEPSCPHPLQSNPPDAHALSLGRLSSHPVPAHTPPPAAPPQPGSYPYPAALSRPLAPAYAATNAGETDPEVDRGSPLKRRRSEDRLPSSASVSVAPVADMSLVPADPAPFPVPPPTPTPTLIHSSVSSSLSGDDVTYGIGIPFRLPPSPDSAWRRHGRDDDVDDDDDDGQLPIFTAGYACSPFSDAPVHSPRGRGDTREPARGRTRASNRSPTRQPTGGELRRQPARGRQPARLDERQQAPPSDVPPPRLSAPGGLPHPRPYECRPQAHLPAHIAETHPHPQASGGRVSGLAHHAAYQPQPSGAFALPQQGGGHVGAWGAGFGGVVGLGGGMNPSGDEQYVNRLGLVPPRAVRSDMNEMEPEREKGVGEFDSFDRWEVVPRDRDEEDVSGLPSGEWVFC
ncbi:hypothetical protein OQA88_4572 [Cercophora sp. LCS_1]